MVQVPTGEPVVPLDPSWPRMSLADATTALTAPGSKFEMESVEIGGLATRVWKHAPHDLGQLLDASRTHGERLFTILDEERVTYEANWRATATLAQALVAMGVRKGTASLSRCAIFPNGLSSSSRSRRSAQSRFRSTPGGPVPSSLMVSMIRPRSC